MQANDLWFNQLTPEFLCRAGGNGPAHPSQLYAIKKYIKANESFLDMGCGGGTTCEAILKAEIDVAYTGIDMIEKNIDFCNITFPYSEFYVDNATNCSYDDKTFDVTYSRHLLEHLPSFEVGLLEQTRIAKRLVIIVLFATLLAGNKDQIKNIEENGKIYTKEYSNKYAKSNILKAIHNLPDWKLVELSEGIGKEVFGNDTVIVLQRR